MLAGTSKGHPFKLAFIGAQIPPSNALMALILSRPFDGYLCQAEKYFRLRERGVWLNVYTRHFFSFVRLGGVAGPSI